MNTIPIRLHWRVIAAAAFFLCIGAGTTAQQGTLDVSFDPGAGAGVNVRTIAVDNNGKVLTGGILTSDLKRRNSNGTVDNSFAVGSGANLTINEVIVQPDDRVLVGGTFTTYSGITRHSIARLQNDGSLDGTFDPGAGASGTAAPQVTAIALQPDGKMIIVGWFTAFNGQARNNIARLNTDGSVDPTFVPGTGASSMVHDVVIQPDGKVIIGGTFGSYDGTARSRIARLNSDGSLDTSFNPGTGADDDIWAIALQPNGKVIAGGAFSVFNGLPIKSIARLNTDGSVDAFDPGTGASGSQAAVRDIALQPDGKIVVAGDFGTFAGSGSNLARLLPNGALDQGFGTGSATDDRINGLALLPDGRVMIGGEFTTCGGVSRRGVARVNGTGIRVLLDGPYSVGLMNDALRTLPTFPLSEPFSAMGYAEPTYSPGATITPTILSTTGNNAIVDWLIVEMRPSAMTGTVSASRAALLQRDGDVVDLDGTSELGFAGLPPGSYCVAIRHRNHLPVMLAPTASTVYGDAKGIADFSVQSTTVHDNDSRKLLNASWVLAAGDVTFDGTVKYAGSNNDRDPILARIGGTVPTATVSGYWREDVNMDGVVKYAGSNNDRDRILNSIGGSVPTATRVATLP